MSRLRTILAALALVAVPRALAGDDGARRAAPSLSLQISATPAAIASGGSLTVSDTVTATGRTVGPFWVRFLLSTDTTIRPPDRCIGSRRVASLAAGASSSGSTAVSVPRKLVGRYWIGAVIGDEGCRTGEAEGEGEDDDGAGVEAEGGWGGWRISALGNAVTIARPDLVPGPLTATPTAVGAGGAITVTDSVSTDGATRKFDVGLFLSQDPVITRSDLRIGTRHVKRLAADGSSTGTTRVELPVTAVGKWWIGAIVDVGDRVAESNEGNDAVAGDPIEIRPPDLTISSLTASPSWVQKPGGKLDLTIVLASTGGATPELRVDYFLSPDTTITPSDLRLGSDEVDELREGESRTGKVHFKVPEGLNGPFYVGAIADSTGVVVESNEANNARAGTLIQIGPDHSPPVIVVSGIADGAVTSDVPVTVCFDAIDPLLASVAGTLDGLPVAACTTVFLEGEHVLTVDAVDTSGNRATQTVRFALDFTPPQIITGGVANGWIGNAAAVTPTFGATDAHLASVFGTLDGVPFVSATPVTAEGDHHLVVTAIDAAGNQATADLFFSLDRTPPAVTITGAVDGWIGKDAAVTPVFAATDFHLASVTGTLDGAPFVSGTAVSAEGTHRLVVTAADLAGNVETRTVSFILDRTPPVVVISGVADGWIGRDAAVAPAFTATDDHLASVAATLDGAPFASGTQVSAEGSHRIVVTATDRAGNVTVREVGFTLDRTPPDVTVTGVTAGWIGKDPSVTPVFSATDLHLASVTGTLDGAPFTSGTAVLAEGDHRLVVTATDQAGNSATKELTFTLDRTAPVITVSGVADGWIGKDASVVPVFGATDLHLASTTATLDGAPFGSGTAVAAEGDHRLVVTASDTAGNTATTTVAFTFDRTAPVVAIAGVANGWIGKDASVAPTFSATDQHLADVTGALDGAPFSSGASVTAEGTHRLVVTANDRAGNVGTSEITFTLDRTPPVVTIAGVSNGYLGKDPSLTPTFGATDATAVTLAATLDGAPFTSGTVVGAEGDHQLVATATDAAGNAASATATFALDRTQPAISFSGVTAGGIYGSSVAPGVAVVDAHPASQSVTLDGVPFVSGVSVDVEGAHVLWASATDGAGNSSSAEVSFAIDRTPPAISITTPADGSLTASADVELVANVTDDRKLDTVTVNGAAVAPGVAGGYRTLVHLVEGANRIEVAARDAAGNGSSSAVTVHLDTTLPVLAVSSPAEGATLSSGSVLVDGTASDLHLSSVKVQGTAVAVGAGGSFSTTLQLAAGPQTIEIVATDTAGNKATVIRNVTVASNQPPTLVVSEPADGFLATSSPITVRGTATSNGGGAIALTVNGEAVPLSGGGFSKPVAATPGPVALTIVATDASGRSTTRQVSGTLGPDAGTGTGTPPTTPPPAGTLAVTIETPTEGAVVGSGTVAVSGRVDGGVAPVQVTVSGVAAVVSAGYFTAALPLVEGDHVLVVRATDSAGNAVQVQRAVSVDHTAPFLTVTRPATSPATATESPYLIQGTVGDTHLASVTVGGLAANLLAGGFSQAVQLQVGDNTVEVVARDAAGNETRRSVLLSIAAMPPTVRILDPVAGASLAAATVQVRARVESTSAVQAVTIGAGPAAPSGGDWVADVALALGANSIAVTATDVNGLTGSASVSVTYRDVSLEPLAVTGVDPVPGASGVEPSTLVSVSFNKEILRDSLPGHFTLTANGVPLAGGFNVAPGGQTVSLVAKEPLPEGSRIGVQVDGVTAAKGPGMSGSFASQFATRERRIEIVGHVLDAQMQPLEDVRVSVEGKGVSTRTGPEGSWHLLGVEAGAVVLRFEGGAFGDGETLPTVQRRLFVSGTETTRDPNLVLIPVDRTAVDHVASGADLHLTFSGRHGPLALDVARDGLYFEGGKTEGFLTATQIPAYALPVPIDNGRMAPTALWQLGPVGVRATRPVDFTFPNLGGHAAGRYAAVYAYDPVRHMIERVGLARVVADGASLRTVQPTTVAGLDFFGYAPVTDDQQAWLDANIAPDGTPLPSAPGSTTPPATGMNGGPASSMEELPLLARLLMLPLGSGTAQAFWGMPGLMGGGAPPEPKVGPATIFGKVRSPQEREFHITSIPDSSTPERTVDLPFEQPVSFKASADPLFSGFTIELKMRAQRGQTVVAPPNGEDWGQVTPKRGIGTVTVNGTVHLEPGTTLITAEGLLVRDSRTVRLEAVLVEQPATTDPVTGKPKRTGKLTVRHLVETEESAASDGISFFQGWPVEVQSNSLYKTTTGTAGRFGVSVFSAGEGQGAVTCTEVQTGLRWIVQADRTDPEKPKLVQWPIMDGFPVCQTIWSVTPGSSSPVSLTVDMRLLMGSIGFFNRDEKAVPIGCAPSDATTWSAKRQELEQINREDVGQTEVYFFREDDLATPIARYAMASTPDEAKCVAGSPAQTDYKRLRFGPSERWTRRDREACDALEAKGTTTGDFYKFYCAGKDRILRLRLSQGDHLIVFAINHATGYAGATNLVVPPITTLQTLGADGKCAADEAAGGPIAFMDFGIPTYISRCAQQDIRMYGNLRLYPPEIDVRVSRKARTEGAASALEEHLIRHGGSATVRDELLHVSTHWRVRLPPEDLDGDGTPNLTDKCPKVPGPPSNFGCPDPANPGWTPPPRILPPPVKPPDPSITGVDSTGGAAWPYQYSGPRPGPAVDPFDADGDGIPDVLYDRDGDGVPDAADRCPTLKGDLANGGCPSGADSDHDGTPDSAEGSACVLQPGPPENKGCPDPNRPYWTPPPSTGVADADSDGVADSLDLCPLFPGPAESKGCPSLLSRFDTDADGVADPDDECPWQPGPASAFGCPDPANPGWTPPEPPKPFAGAPGRMLETYCSELTNPSPEEIRACTRFEARLMEVPAGVPPLAGQLVRVTGSAVEQPAVSVFPILPGKETSTIQAALRLKGVDGSPKITNLSRANYYVHVVGNLTLFNDKDGDGRIDPATEIAVSPPAFSEPDPLPTDWKAGMPVRAIPLKNVYKSLEPDGSVLARFDRDREHEFRVVELAMTSVTAAQADGTSRSVSSPIDATKANTAIDGDLSYQMLMSLIAPSDPARSGVLPGTYQVRMGTDQYGIDCGVEVGTPPGTLTATCDGAWLFDVLSGSDLLYIGLYMSGNAENILYKYNLQGLSPRHDLVTAGHSNTSAKSIAPDDATGKAATLRSISEPALANVFLGPTQLKKGRVKLCAGACGAEGLIREFDLQWQDSGSYQVTEVGGRGAIEQVPRAGLDSASLFRLPIPNQHVEMPGRLATGAAAPQGIQVQWTNSEDPTGKVNDVQLGKAVGVYQGANGRAPGQADLGGVNVADGHVAVRHEDFSLPEFAGRVRFERTYNNQDNEIGTLGTGWRHNFEAYVVEEALGRYTMVLEGQSYDFPTCKTSELNGQKSATDCTTDNAHGGKLSVQERPEADPKAPRHVPDVVFEAPNGVRYRFDRYSQKALQLVSNADAYTLARAVQELAEYQVKSNVSTPINARPTVKKIRDAGRRRWILTAVDDGHGRADATDPVKPGAGWTIVEYFADSDMIRRVYRKGGKLGLYFGYDPVDPASTLSTRFKAAAVAENFGLLRTVEARFQTAAGDGTPEGADSNGVPSNPSGFIAKLTLTRDARGNLTRAARVASEDKTTVDQEWAYGYVADPQTLSGPEGKLVGQRLWEASNEIEKAELKLFGVTQWRTKWRRTLGWGAGRYPHTNAFEAVDRVVLPGTSKVGSGSAPTDANDVETEIQLLSETQRRIVRPDKVTVDVDLTTYGSVTAEKIGISTSETDWFNQTNEAERVAPQARAAPGGRKLSFETTPRLLPTSTAVKAGNPNDTVPVKGLAVGAELRRTDEVDRDPRFGTAEKTTRATSTGSSLLESPVDDKTGDPSRVSVKAEDHTTELTSWSADKWDVEGVLEVETDAVGRVTTHTGTSVWGLRPVATTVLGTAAPGGVGSVARTREFDWLGRVKREYDDRGHEQKWEYDAAGRLLRHFVSGTPALDVHYQYTQGAERELTVTETMPSSLETPGIPGHTRTKVYRDGQLVKESWAYGAQGALALRTWEYEGGRLASWRDERRIDRVNHYDDHGKLEYVVATDPETNASLEEVRYLRDYSRDAEGKVQEETDQNGLVTKTFYDLLGRPAKWSYGLAKADGSAEDVETTNRDPSGVTTERTHGKFTWESAIDALGRVRSVAAKGKTGELNTLTEYDKLGRKTRNEDTVLGLVEEWKYDDVFGRQTYYKRTVAPWSGVYEETRAYVDSSSEHKVQVVQKVAGQDVKTSTVWLDAQGRTLHTLDFVERGGVRIAADRYFTYDARGNVLAQFEPIGDGPTSNGIDATTATTARSSNAWDAVGNLLSETDAKGTTTTYVVNAAGLVEEKLGPYPGERWTFKFDAFGQLRKKTLEPPTTPSAGWKGAVWGYEYRLASGATARETDPRGYVTDRWYNARQQLLKEVRTDQRPGRATANVRTTTFDYDGPWVARQVTTEGTSSTTLRRENGVLPGYDHRGRVLRETEEFAGPNSASYSYSLINDWTGRTAAMTQSWTTAAGIGSRSGIRVVDALENVVSQSWGLSRDEWTYDGAGRLAEERLAGKPVRTFVYKEGLLETTSLLPVGGGAAEETTNGYWGSGKLNTTLGPDGRTRRLTWNERGLLAKEELGTDPSWDTKQYTYDAAGNVATTTHGLVPGETSDWSYTSGPRGELLSVVQPGAIGAFAYAYDERGALASITPPAGSPVPGQTFDYDYLGRQVTRTRGTATWTTSWENGASTLTDPELANGQRTIYRVLDGRGRTTLERFSGVPSDLTEVSTDFDPLDQPVRVREQRGSGNVTVTYGYETDRRLLTSIDRGGETLTYGRTASGQLDYATSPAGTVKYTYDPFDRLKSIDVGTRSTTVGWEPGGARLTSLEGGGLNECRRYDARGRLSLVANLSPGDSCESAASPLAEYAYGYDDRGNRVTEAYRDASTVVADPTRYGYDGADRLTGVQYPGGTAKLYKLAPDGSRLGEKEVPGYGLGSLGPAAYDARATAYTQSYGHDARGHLTAITDSDGATAATFTVDAAGRVRSETRGPVVKGFTWDAGSRLTTVTTTSSGGAAAQTLAYRYDAAGLRVLKTTAAGDTKYLWGAQGLAEEVAPDGTRTMYERQGGLVAGVTVKVSALSSSERFMHDGLDSVVGRVKSDGTSTLYKYDAWGNFRGAAKPGAGEPSLAYAGQHWDDEAGLSYAQQRWYDAATGRFLSEDPVGPDDRLLMPNGLHRFGYADGNPLGYRDPEGLESQGEYADRLLCEEARKAGRTDDGCQVFGVVDREVKEGNGSITPAGKFIGGFGMGIGKTVVGGVQGGWWLLKAAALNVSPFPGHRERSRAMQQEAIDAGVKGLKSQAGLLQLAWNNPDDLFQGLVKAGDDIPTVMGEATFDTFLWVAPTAKGLKGGAAGELAAEADDLAAAGKAAKTPAIESPARAPAPTPAAPPPVAPAKPAGLLPGEGAVGAFDDLIEAGTKGDNITPHHIPSNKLMESLGVERGDALAINMEHPVPGAGGRHRKTFTYGRAADATMSPRDALAAGIWDARGIYRAEGLYGPYVREQLQCLVSESKTAFPRLFGKR